LAGTPALAAENADRSIAAALGDAWNRGDGEAWGAQFWPDARFVNVLGTVFAGREAIEAQHTRIFATIYKGSRNEFVVSNTRALGPDHPLVELDGTAAGITRLKPGITAGADGKVHAHLMLVTERRGGEWRIAYAQNTVVAPPPPEPSAR